MKARSGPLPERVVAVLPALVAVAAFAFLSGIPSCRDIRAARNRARDLGDVEGHALQAATLRRNLDEASAELASLRAAETHPRLGGGGAGGFGAATPAAALGEAHRRILGHGAHVLRVTPAARGESADGNEARRLLRLQTGREPRSWSVAVEAPWGAVQGLLDDVSSGTNGPAPALVASLTMRPAVGAGKPACWLFTISQ